MFLGQDLLSHSLSKNVINNNITTGVYKIPLHIFNFNAKFNRSSETKGEVEKSLILALCPCGFIEIRTFVPIPCTMRGKLESGLS